MRIFCTDQFRFFLPEGHTFPIDKYTLLRQRVLATSLVRPEELSIPHVATDKEITRAHDAGYLRRVKNGELTAQEIRRIGFPWSADLVERARRSSGATIEACRTALEDGLAVNLAGGTHHAFRDRGEGFCVFNDSVIASRAMQIENRARRIVIIDCDVHQGNGTAAILAGDSTVFTFSIHGENNFPVRKEKSDLDIPLQDGADDMIYLEALEKGLRRSLRLADPDLAIYLAGADPFVGDRYGHLALSKEGLAQRDQLVLDHCRRRDIPVAITMAGGYARQVEDTVDIHVQTVKRAAEMT